MYESWDTLTLQTWHVVQLTPTNCRPTCHSLPEHPLQSSALVPDQSPSATSPTASPTDPRIHADPPAPCGGGSDSGRCGARRGGVPRPWTCRGRRGGRSRSRKAAVRTRGSRAGHFRCFFFLREYFQKWCFFKSKSTSGLNVWRVDQNPPSGSSGFGSPDWVNL